MKKLFLLLFCLFCFLNFSNAQDTGFVDERLKEVLSEDYINKIYENDANHLKFLNWELDNSYSISNLPLYKVEGMPYLRYYNKDTHEPGDTVLSLDSSKINIHNYYFERKYEFNHTYRVGDSGDVIIFFSSKSLAYEFNKHNTK